MRKFTFLILAASFIYGCSGGDNDIDDSANIPQPVNSALIQVTQIVGVGMVEPEGEIVSLAAQTGGLVTEILKHDGEKVNKGEAILFLDNELEQIRVRQLATQYETQKAQVDIDAAALAESRVKLSNKERLLESVKSLTEKGAETAKTLDDAETEVEALRLNVEKSSAALAFSTGRLQELNTQLEYAVAEAERKILRSPYEGLLLETHVRKGAAVIQYSSYADIAPTARTIVSAEVDELFVNRLRTDLQVGIRHIGSDSTIARGTIYFLSPYLKKKSLFSGKSGEQEDRLVREVKIMLDSDPGLLFGSKVECVIKL